VWKVRNLLPSFITIHIPILAHVDNSDTININKKEQIMRFPRKPSILFLVLFLLGYGINYFVGIELLGVLTALMAIISAIFFLIGR
jgi:hypothetical protein